MPFTHLDDDTLWDVLQAAMDLGFNTDANLTALGAGISPAFLGQVTVGGNPNARLLTSVQEMNRTRNLVSGEVPLHKWLDNAIFLAAGRQEETVFRAALAAATPDSIDPPDPPDVAAAPRRATGALEVEIDEDDTLGVEFLHRGAEVSRSIARLLVHRHLHGEPSYQASDEPDWGRGTGWLIAPRLVITNHHVVAARSPSEAAAGDDDFALQGRATTVQFDVYGEGSPPLEAKSVECVASDPALDFALLRLPADAPARRALRLRKTPLSKPAAAALRQRVNVLQHPRGEAMRLGFRNNFVVSGTSQRLSYLTDTAGGSSGSPVCDDRWLVAALHRGWRNIASGPVSVWGKSIWQENYGVPIRRILEHLEAQTPAFYAEIATEQKALDEA